MKPRTMVTAYVGFVAATATVFGAATYEVKTHPALTRYERCVVASDAHGISSDVCSAFGQTHTRRQWDALNAADGWHPSRVTGCADEWTWHDRPPGDTVPVYVCWSGEVR